MPNVQEPTVGQDFTDQGGEAADHNALLTLRQNRQTGLQRLRRPLARQQEFKIVKNYARGISQEYRAANGGQPG